MFWFDWVLIALGVVLVFFASLAFLFSNTFFDFLVDTDIHCIVFCFGIVFCLLPFLFNSFFNRCDVCKIYVSSDYCTACGSYVAADSFCSCGAELDERYSFCPSCGCDLEVSYD